MSTLASVQVVYCAEDKQYLIQVPLVANMTALQAIEASGLSQQTDLPDVLQVGIFSLKLENPETYLVNAGDRLEIYRPLKMNPKEVRRRRARQNPVGNFGKGNRWNRQQKSTD